MQNANEAPGRIQNVENCQLLKSTKSILDWKIYKSKLSITTLFLRLGNDILHHPQVQFAFHTFLLTLGVHHGLCIFSWLGVKKDTGQPFIPFQSAMPCADPESFVRRGPTLTKSFFYI